MFSRFFIDRPIFAAVLSIFIVIAGLAGMRSLPIAQYPEIAPPVVLVRAVYPGASAETLEQTVAAPLENAINGIEDMLYMNSTSSSSGVVEIYVTFNIGADVDKAALNVNNRVKQAEPRLPEEVRRQGVFVEKGSSAFLQVLAFYSPDGRYDDFFTSNYVTLNVLDSLKRVPGTTNVQIFGAKDYAMRIWVRPDRLAQLKLAPSDLIRALGEQNAQFAAGKVGEPPTGGGQEVVYNVTTKGRLTDPKEFENVILRANPDGSRLRLKDVARVELASKDYSFIGKVNGKPATLVGVFLQPGANALDVAANVKATVDSAAKSFPQGLAYSVPYDTTRFVEVSIREVVKTLAEAMVLVFLVVFLFLQNWRATLIPFAAVPVSLVGTFAGLLLLGYSINTLTLFGMVLAIGIVVDDAIVVLENVERIMREEQVSAREAAIKAMHEVTGPVIAIVLVLCAVFVPIAFLGGLTGELYRQFAVTISVSVVISGIVALTLTPALAALILKPAHAKPWAPFALFNRFFAWVTELYTGGVGFLLRHAVLGIAGFVLVLGATWALFQRIPGSLVPAEDQGYVFMVTILPPAAAIARTREVTKDATAALLENPAVANVVTFSGFDLLSRALKTNSGISFVTLKDWSQRKDAAQDARNVAPSLARINARFKDGIVIGFNPPPIIGISVTGGFEFFLQDRSGGPLTGLGEAVNKVVAAANQRPELRGVQTTFTTSVPQYRIDVDRDKARALGIPINAIFDTMQSSFGSLYVNDFSLFGRTYRVSISSEADFREKPDDMRHVFVRSDNNVMVPLSELVTFTRTLGPDAVERFNIFPAAKVIGGPAPGYSSGQAIAAMREVVASTVSRDFTIGWIGSAYQELATAGSGQLGFVFGLVMVFLILAAQYERWSLPLAVLTAVPFAVLGALLAIWWRGLDNDVYFQIGLVTLIGLAAKNAILIIEFAAQRHRQGATVYDAAIEAARLRFRPIVMTSLAFVLGVLPLAISTGAGSASRHSIGTGVIGGMLAATFVAILFVPVFFRLLTPARKAPSKPEESPGRTFERPSPAPGEGG